MPDAGSAAFAGSEVDLVSSDFVVAPNVKPVDFEAEESKLNPEDVKVGVNPVGLPSVYGGVRPVGLSAEVGNDEGLKPVGVPKGEGEEPDTGVGLKPKAVKEGAALVDEELVVVGLSSPGDWQEMHSSLKKGRCEN